MSYKVIVKQISSKKKERKELQKQKKSTPVIKVITHRDLARRIAELTEEIEELKSEKARLIIAMERTDDKDVSTVNDSLDRMKSALTELDRREVKYTADLNEALQQYAEYKEQSKGFNAGEFGNWVNELGIITVVDSFGKTRNVDDIDCFISKSQFKMWKIYKKKCEGININPWDYHQQQMQLNNLVWGVTRINRINDDDYKTLNYQYLQALQLKNSDIDLVCAQTDELLTALNSGDIQTVYNNLLINAKDCSDILSDDELFEESNYKKLFQRIIEVN